jgi:hypothetical protein
MKKKTMLLEASLLIPCLAIILNNRICVDVVNRTLIFFGINTSESHLTIGEWLIVAYIFLLPMAQLLFFTFPKSVVNLNLMEKSILWFSTLFISAVAWHMYSENIILIT